MPAWPDDLWEQTAPNTCGPARSCRLNADNGHVLEGRPAAGEPATFYDGLAVQRVMDAVRDGAVPRFRLTSWNRPLPTRLRPQGRHRGGPRGRLSTARLVDRIRAHGYGPRAATGPSARPRVRVLLTEWTRVEYGYETRTSFPSAVCVSWSRKSSQTARSTGSLQAWGSEFLRGRMVGEFDFHEITRGRRAFFRPSGHRERFRAACRASDACSWNTTCGSVLTCWKRVASYAKDGFTAVIYSRKVLPRGDEGHLRASHQSTRAGSTSCCATWRKRVRWCCRT